MSQALGAFGLLDFTMLLPVLAWPRFVTYEPFITLIFNFCSGRGKSRITANADTGTADADSVDTGARLFF
jgi:hypothetical protein